MTSVMPSSARCPVVVGPWVRTGAPRTRTCSPAFVDIPAARLADAVPRSLDQHEATVARPSA
ncbi:hypothetical protein [Streptomyces sp. ID05-04B]|uniref:hypothetical protein n=1 Tax=Streptomyces sp. ID05-04B TaxID=3028661 RepID=UPI0029C9C097|nr:hypothetical protein [Streptomyces sp. ID05-04B]